MSVPRPLSSKEDLEQAQASQHRRLYSLVQELRLEISYYQGETKRLEWEKNVLKQDVDRLSHLFTGWLQELESNKKPSAGKAPSRSIIYNSHYLSTLVKYPIKPLCDLLQLADVMFVMTTCQPPFFVEYSNKAWTSFWGWESHEIVGLTMTFMQGAETDMRTAAAFTRDFKDVGYAVMRVHNYQKRGALYAVTVTVFPVYDTATFGDARLGESTSEPVLTHFCTVFSDVVLLAPSTGDDTTSGSNESGGGTGSERDCGNHKQHHINHNHGVNDNRRAMGMNHGSVSADNSTGSGSGSGSGAGGAIDSSGSGGSGKVASSDTKNSTTVAATSSSSDGNFQSNRMLFAQATGSTSTMLGGNGGGSGGGIGIGGGSGVVTMGLPTDDNSPGAAALAAAIATRQQEHLTLVNHSHNHNHNSSTGSSSSEPSTQQQSPRSIPASPSVSPHAQHPSVIIEKKRKEEGVDGEIENPNRKHATTGTDDEMHLLYANIKLDHAQANAKLLQDATKATSIAKRSHRSSKKEQPKDAKDGVSSASSNREESDDMVSDGMLYDADASVGENEQSQDENSNPSTLSNEGDIDGDCEDSSESASSESDALFPGKNGSSRGNTSTLSSSNSNDQDNDANDSPDMMMVMPDHVTHRTLSPRGEVKHDNGNNSGNSNDVKDPLSTSELDKTNQNATGTHHGGMSGFEQKRLSKFALLPFKVLSGTSDLRAGCKALDARCTLSPETFFKYAYALRLSDMLRLMSTCDNALILCDRYGRVVHMNRSSTDLFKYPLSEVEGHTLHFMYQQPSDIILFEQCSIFNARGEPTDVVMKACRKLGPPIYCRVVTAPIKGGVNNLDITHFAMYFHPVPRFGGAHSDTSSSSSSSSASSDEMATGNGSPGPSEHAKTSQPIYPTGPADKDFPDPQSVSDIQINRITSILKHAKLPTPLTLAADEAATHRLGGRTYNESGTSSSLGAMAERVAVPAVGPAGGIGVGVSAAGGGGMTATGPTSGPGPMVVGTSGSGSGSGTGSGNSSDGNGSNGAHPSHLGHFPLSAPSYSYGLPAPPAPQLPFPLAPQAFQQQASMPTPAVNLSGSNPSRGIGLGQPVPGSSLGLGLNPTGDSEQQVHMSYSLGQQHGQHDHATMAWPEHSSVGKQVLTASIPVPVPTIPGGQQEIGVSPLFHAHAHAAGLRVGLPVSVPLQASSSPLSLHHSDDIGSHRVFANGQALMTIADGYFNGIVASEQDHYHHSDHFHMSTQDELEDNESL